MARKKPEAEDVALDENGRRMDGRPVADEKAEDVALDENGRRMDEPCR